MCDGQGGNIIGLWCRGWRDQRERAWGICETLEWLWVCGRTLRETVIELLRKSIKHFNGFRSVEWLFLAAYTRLRLDHWDPGLVWVRTQIWSQWENLRPDPEFPGLTFLLQLLHVSQLPPRCGAVEPQLHAQKAPGPFRLSLCQGLSRERRSDTEPWVSS